MGVMRHACFRRHEAVPLIVKSILVNVSNLKSVNRISCNLHVNFQVIVFDCSPYTPHVLDILR